MPDVEEVFHMATQKVLPEPGALERQNRNQRRRSTRRKAGAFALVAAIVAVGVGVAIALPRIDDRSKTPAVQPSTTVSGPATQTTTPVPSTSGTPSPEASPILAEGRSFGFIKSIDLTNSTLVFDLAQFFTGDAAVKAAREDGVIGPNQGLDNDNYIRNVNPMLRTVPLARDAQVFVFVLGDPGCCTTPEPIDLATFAGEFQSPSAPFYGAGQGYWLTVEHGAIAKIEQQFTP